MLTIRKFAAACLLQGCAIGLTVFAGGAQTAVAAENSACQPGYRTHLDARVANAADQGPDGLRRFVTRTRTIYAFDYQEAAARVERHRQTQKACAEQIASAK